MRMRSRQLQVFFWCWLLVGLSVSCSRFTPPAELPVASSLILDELVVYSDFTLPENHRLLGELEQMRAQLTQTLLLPVSDEPVEVYLFKTPRRYRRFLTRHYPQFADRRAFFVQTDTRLCVYTYWGDRIAEDLRHEVCHGYLHAVVPQIPLWLDEGLAEFYERDRSEEGFHQEYSEFLRTARDQGDWQPGPERLAELTQVEDMTEIDYAEAWLWTHFLLKTTDLRKKILRDYLSAVRQGDSETLIERLHKFEPDAERQVLFHLDQMQSADILAP